MVADAYSGPPLVSLHQNLRSGLGVKLGDELTFTIFGEPVTARVANFRDYSWQGGIDFLATFSPGVLEVYPATLLGAVTADCRAAKVSSSASWRPTLPDVRFIAIGQTLELITDGARASSRLRPRWSAASRSAMACWCCSAASRPAGDSARPMR